LKVTQPLKIAELARCLTRTKISHSHSDSARLGVAGLISKVARRG